MKKTIKTLLALSLVVGLLAGCGNAKVDDKESSQPASESSSVADTTEVVESKYPEYLNLDGYRPIVADGEEITLSMTISPSSVAQETDPEDKWFYQFIEQVLNIQLDVDPNWNSERRSIILNSGELPDMMWSPALTAGELIIYGQEGGLFLDLNEYISEELTPNIVAAMEEYPDAFAACVTPDGAMYTLPRIAYPAKPNGGLRMFVDTDYLAAAGITELPTTLDEFTDMLRAFKALDPEKMGVDEIIPLVANWKYDQWYYMSAWGWVTNSYSKYGFPCWDEAEQEVVIPCLQDKFKDYVKYVHMLYQEDLVCDDYFSISTDQARALFAEGKVPVVCDSTMTASQPDRVGNYVHLSPVTSEWTDKPIATQSTADFSIGGVAVSAETQYPEVIMRFLDYLYSAEGNAYAGGGPVAGTEDELGMVNGVIAFNGTPTNKDVAEGKVATAYEYQQTKLILDGSMSIHYAGKNMDYIYDRVGLGAPETAEEYIARNIQSYQEGYESYQVFVSQYPYLVSPLQTPYATVEQTERLTDLQTVMQNYCYAEFAKFVVGERPIEELDAFMEELWALDGQELWDLAQEIYKR